MGKPRGNRSENSGNGTIKVKKSTQRWDALPETNLAFVNYYKAQKIVPDDQEWDQFFETLRTDLPTTFRITGSKKNSLELVQIIKETYVPFLSKVEINGEPIPPPRQLPWYPNGLAWESRAPKQTIRKSPEFKKFQNFLVYETEAGNLSRQEAVSMIPTLLLDVEPHHYIFDACAAPGSKTAQLVESLHSASSSVIPSGLLIANDSDYKRSHLLVHQSLRRLPSPSTMITNHDASMFPSLKINGQRLMFDRILCDVPCSGDGTLRKNGAIWRDWTPANGIGLHGLQLRILSRCISLLKPGGRMVYSTCSLNPLENEAVVSAALLQHPEMSLLDVSDSLPELVRRPGMTTWKVMRRQVGEMIELKSFSELDGSPDQIKYPSTLWPDGKESERGLERCLRIYPHLQNTGGFFVAVLVKATSASVDDEPINSDSLNKRSVDELSKSPKERQSKKSKTDTQVSETIAIEDDVQDTKSDVAKDDELNLKPNDAGDLPTVASAVKVEPTKITEHKPSSEKNKTRGFKEEPYTYIKDGNEDVKNCVEFFGLNSKFPANNLLVRNLAGTPTRTIYLTSPSVRGVIESNSHDRLRLICCGVKIFGRDNSNSVAAEGPAYRCKWRIVSDGIEFCRPFMNSSRVIRSGLKSLRQLVSNPDQYPLFETIEDESFRRVVQAIEPGSCVMEIVGEPDEHVPHDLVVGMWISKASVNLMVDKKERRVLSLRLWGEDLTVDASSKGVKKEDVKEDDKSDVKMEGEVEAATDLDTKDVKQDEVVKGEEKLKVKQEGENLKGDAKPKLEVKQDSADGVIATD